MNAHAPINLSSYFTPAQVKRIHEAWATLHPHADKHDEYLSIYKAFLRLMGHGRNLGVMNVVEALCAGRADHAKWLEGIRKHCMDIAPLPHESPQPTARLILRAAPIIECLADPAQLDAAADQGSVPPKIPAYDCSPLEMLDALKSGQRHAVIPNIRYPQQEKEAFVRQAREAGFAVGFVGGNPLTFGEGEHPSNKDRLVGPPEAPACLIAGVTQADYDDLLSTVHPSSPDDLCPIMMGIALGYSEQDIAFFYRRNMQRRHGWDSAECSKRIAGAWQQWSQAPQFDDNMKGLFASLTPSLAPAALAHQQTHLAPAPSQAFGF